MLRASSLGLTFRPSATRGHRPCFLTHSAPVMLSPCANPNKRVLCPSGGGRGQYNVDENTCLQNWLPRRAGVSVKGFQVPGQGEGLGTLPVDLRIPLGQQILAPLKQPRDDRAFRLPGPPGYGARPRESLYVGLYRPLVVETRKQQRNQVQKAFKVRTERIKSHRHVKRNDKYAQLAVDTSMSKPSGLPMRPTPIKSLRQRKVPTRKTGVINLRVLRQSLLRTLAITSSASEGWEAYSDLLMIDRSDDIMSVSEPNVPFAHMHRLCRLLARNKPKTRSQFLRLLSVLTAIKDAGGHIHVHEWNALIDGAGKGWRKTRPNDFKTAFSLYKDMITGKAPGASLLEDNLAEESGSSMGAPVEADIYTYTTLISLAARTFHSPAFRHATSLLEASGLPPNRITHLSLLRYFTYTKQISGIRSTLLKMQQQGFELGLDGINACIWSYGHSGRLDIVMMIYRLLRHNVNPEMHVGEDDVRSVARQLQEEYIVVPPDMKANEVTFTTMIQTMAYHGNLLATLTVFIDMVSAPSLEMGASLARDRNGILGQPTYSPTLPIFRAIFLGFSRHGIPAEKERSRVRTLNPSRQPKWSLENLRSLFDMFLALPEDVVPSKSTIYWIMIAFEKTSGNDVALLRRIWMELEDRFKRPWGGSENRLQRLKSTLFHGQSKSGERI